MALFHFIKSLTEPELSVIKPAFGFKKVRKKILPGSQLSEFLDVILSTPLEQLSDDYVMGKMKEKLSIAQYTKLKSRVLSKLLDKICSDKFLRDEEIIKGTERAEVRIKKKLLAIQILRLKTAKSDKKIFLRLANEVIDEAKEYELYDALVEALMYKQYHFAARSGYSDYSKLKEEIEFFSACSLAKRQANNYYFELIANQKLVSHFSESEIEQFLDEKVRLLEASPFTTVSGYVQYYYKVLKLAQQQKDKKNRESIDTCLELISLLNRNKAIARTERFGFVYGNLAQCLTYQREFKEAAQIARTAQQYFPHNSLSYVLTAEQEFFACFYGGDYKRCREVLELMSVLNKRDSGQIRLDSFTYYQACLEFAEGNFREAKFITNLSLSISKDKHRWDLGIRYLKIMSLIELKEHEEARDAIEALRKQMERNSGEGKPEISSRDNFIYRALKEYANQNFEGSSNKMNYFLKQLSLKESENGWRFFTHEVVPVHRWLRKQIKPLNGQKTELLSKSASKC